MRYHNGKIGRLPRVLREQVNQLLFDGTPARPILYWLNTHPAVQIMLANHFGGKPINEPNLSHWRTGGYQAWQKRQELSALIRHFADHRSNPVKPSQTSPASFQTADLVNEGLDRLQNYPGTSDPIRPN